MRDQHNKDANVALEKSPAESATDVLAVAQLKVQKADAKKRGRNYILERIAMQQDCVEESPDAFILDRKFGKRSDIHQRIAQQMDIPGDEYSA